MSNSEADDASSFDSEGEDNDEDLASRLKEDLSKHEDTLYLGCREIEELSRELCDKNKISENDYISISNKTKDIYTSYNSVVDSICVMNQHVSLVYESMTSNMKFLEEENTRLKVACKNND